MIIRANNRSIKFLRESGHSIVFCTLRNGVPCFDTERMMTKKEFEKFLKGPRGVRMKYEFKTKLGTTCIIWKKGVAAK